MLCKQGLDVFHVSDFVQVLAVDDYIFVGIKIVFCFVF